MSAPRLFDRDLLRKRRERAARRPDKPDFLLRRAAEDMTERLQGIERRFSRILNAGAHHGLLSRMLTQTYPEAETVISLELAPGLAALCPAPKVIGDEELLPFAGESFDLVVSALALHFVNDLPGALVQIRRALRPDGLFLGAVLGGATLSELREAFMQAELELEGGVSPRVAPAAEIRDFGGLLQRAGFALPVADSDLVTVTYDSPLALMLELRAMGAGNNLVERRKRPLRRQTLRRAAEIYGERFPASGGRVKATFEIIHIAGWAPHESQQKPLKPGSAAARLADALGVAEQKVKGTRPR